MSAVALGVRHYIELTFANCAYLLANVPQLVVEPRENLLIEPAGRAIAQRVVQGVSWPAYALDANLEPTTESPWTRAIFLNAAERGVGILVNDMRLVPVDQLRIEPFLPLGPVPAGGQPLFDAASMSKDGLMLVFSVEGLAAHLHYQERRHGRTK